MVTMECFCHTSTPALSLPHTPTAPRAGRPRRGIRLPQKAGVFPALGLPVLGHESLRWAGNLQPSVTEHDRVVVGR